MTTINIRTAQSLDLTEILALYAQLDRDHVPVLSLEQAQAILTRITRYPDYNIYLATMDDKVVGTFALLVMDNLAHLGAPAAVIEDVVVSLRHRGQGIGRQMMEWAIDRCREKGCYKVALSSNLKREEAHRFYESLGFRKHGYSFALRLIPHSSPDTSADDWPSDSRHRI